MVFGTLDYAAVFANVASHANDIAPIAGMSVNMLTAICILLFIGAMGKSAQFPLHVWLPDSMEGPTPISALIHAATMVTAGIFMVARMSPMFEQSDTALSFVMIIGAITALFMGFLGIIQNDIKRVIAYSTLSQLGYMTVALGAVVPRRRQRDHLHAPRSGYPQHGRPEEIYADHLDYFAYRIPGVDRNPLLLGILFQRQHHRSG